MRDNGARMSLPSGPSKAREHALTLASHLTDTSVKLNPTVDFLAGNISVRSPPSGLSERPHRPQVPDPLNMMP